MYILGIETSCDETAASVVKADPKTNRVSVLSNTISSQIDIHAKYGGVVPEVAAREHVLNILPVIDEAMKQARITEKDINYIAVTKGPGLITSLISGVETVRALSYTWNKPVIEVNHIEGHIYSNFINLKEKIKFPAVILTVSGGHTTLLLMDKSRKIKTIGDTRDDAAGEAFDKGAKMMNLGYPGGPIISKLAGDYKGESDIILPRPMLNSKDYDFSFSGLKTALLYQLQKDKQWKKRIPEYCHAYQQAIIDVLVGKTIKAAKEYKVKTVMLAGGVSANKELRLKMAKKVEKELDKVDFLMPDLKYTTDNAVMIATAAYFKRRNRGTSNFKSIKVDASLQLK